MNYARIVRLSGRILLNIITCVLSVELQFSDVARIGRSGEASLCASFAAHKCRRKPETWKAWFWLVSLPSQLKATRNIRTFSIFLAVL